MTNTNTMSDLVENNLDWLEYSKTATKKELLDVILDLKQYETCFDDYNRAIEIRENLQAILTR